MEDPITRDWTGNVQSDTPEVVAQQVRTRLLLWEGEFFLDTSDGTPYLQDIFDPIGITNYDLEIQSRILGTPGVLELLEYTSSVDNRKLTVNCKISTEFGTTTQIYSVYSSIANQTYGSPGGPVVAA